MSLPEPWGTADGSSRGCNGGSTAKNQIQNAFSMFHKKNKVLQKNIQLFSAKHVFS
jgi:hypothetical protein